jgi:hypothetical protein
MKVIAALVLAQGVILRKDAPHVLAKTESTAKVEKVHAQVNTSLSAALSANMSKVEYPCGDSAKVAGFTKYRAMLVEGTCGIVTATPFCGDTHGFECMLNEFYSAGCAGVTKAPADLCEKCTDPHALGYGLDKTYFPFAVEKFYESDYAYFNTINSNTILRTELFCASMMMVQDGCASGTTVVTCFK